MTIFFADVVYMGNILTLVNVRENDAGDVHCIAENGYPPIVSQKFELTIHCKYINITISCEAFFNK
jgi:hypothetical protein